MPCPINGRVSHWYDELPAYRPALPGDRDADVCIVGAGYTGLWTAYYLKRADPSLRVAVLEARFAGFGASGRNGGWLSGLVPGDRNRMAQEYGRDGVVAWQRALNEAVDEVIDVAAREGIDAGIVKGGTLQIARNPAQASRLSAEIDEELSWKVDVERLTKTQAAERIKLDGVLAAYHNPHCARVQPARLARGLADVVARLGVDIYEQSPVTAFTAGRASTPHGTVTAPIVLRATEGFTAALPGLRRRWLPMNSSMIATDPIPDDVWETIGWRGCETLGNAAHGFFYAQRTDDNLIAIGGRSVPYRFGSRTDADGRVPERTIAHTAGAACWRCRGTGRPASRSTRLPDWVGPVDMSATASPRQISPAAPWPIWCWINRVRLPSCRGWATGRPTGSPSRCAGWVCAACIWRTSWPTGTKREAGRPPRRSPSSPTRSQAGPSALRPSP